MSNEREARWGFRVMVALFALIVFGYIADGFSQAARLVQGQSHARLSAILLGMITLAGVLTAFKLSFQATYGLVELMFGIVVGMKAIRSPSVDAWTFGIAVMGAVYIMGRGSLNIFEPFSRERLETRRFIEESKKELAETTEQNRMTSEMTLQAAKARLETLERRIKEERERQHRRPE